VATDPPPPPPQYKVVKQANSWLIEPQGNGWVFERTYPTKWKAELALEIWQRGGRVSDYWAAARERKQTPTTVRPPAPRVAQSNDAVTAIYNYAAGLMKDGASPAIIQAKLVEAGLDNDSAAIVVNNLLAARARARKEAAGEMMLGGGLACAFGIIVTVVTYALASAGGWYIVAWGAIAVGAIQFLRGLWYYLET
jgi:hypothetical protein